MGVTPNNTPAVYILGFVSLSMAFFPLKLLGCNQLMRLAGRLGGRMRLKIVPIEILAPHSYPTSIYTPSAKFAPFWRSVLLFHKDGQTETVLVAKGDYEFSVLPLQSLLSVWQQSA